MKSWPVNGIGDITNISADTLLYDLITAPPVSYLAFCTEAQYDSLVAYIQGLNARIELTNDTVVTPSRVVLRGNSTLPAYYRSLTQNHIVGNLSEYIARKFLHQTSFGASNKNFRLTNGKFGDVYLIAAKIEAAGTCVNTGHYVYVNDVIQYCTATDKASSNPDYPSYYTFLNSAEAYTGYTFCFGIMRYNDTYRTNHTASELSADFNLLNISAYSGAVDRYEYPSVEATNNFPMIQQLIEWESNKDLSAFIASMQQELEVLQNQVDTLLSN